MEVDKKKKTEIKNEMDSQATSILVTVVVYFSSF